MASVKRKVKNVNSNGKKSFWNLTKKQTWILGGILGALIVAAAVIITIVLINNNNSDEENKPDYFLNTSEVIAESDVVFEKSTFAGAKNYAYGEDGLKVDHLFVFAYDSSTFYPVKDKYYNTDSDGNKTDKYDKDHLEIYNKLVELQKAINNACEASPELAKELKLVVIDLSKGDGSSLLQASFENKDNFNIQFVKSELSSPTFVFSYLNEGSLKTNVEINSNEKSIYGTGVTIQNDAIVTAINYVNQLVADLTK